MKPIEWSRMLQAAVSPGEITSIASVYLSQLSAEEQGSLPTNCRAGLVMDIDDVSAWATRFDAQIAAPGRCSSAVIAAQLMFSAAAHRLAHLSQRPVRFRTVRRLESAA